MKISVVQPSYYSGENPDVMIAEFLVEKMKAAERDSLIVLPEYSNAGGLSDPQRELLALERADVMLNQASEIAKKNHAYIAINVLIKREGALKNSTYLFDRDGEVKHIYDKIHLPPSEIALGVERGIGNCVCELDGLRIGFMTCYDVYFNEQIEYIAGYKPDIIIIPVYQRRERTDIIRAQAKLIAFRCNAYVARASYSMEDEKYGGCSMIAAPDGQVLKDLGKQVGSIALEIDPKWKYMRSAGFGGNTILNDDFISTGICMDAFR